MNKEVTSVGYVVGKRTPKGGRIYEHRIVAKAKKGFIVHHKNGDKSDNRPENLEIMTQSQHCREHAPHISRWGKPVSKKCVVCGITNDLKRGLCNKHYRRLKYYDLLKPLPVVHIKK